MATAKKAAKKTQTKVEPTTAGVAATPQTAAKPATKAPAKKEHTLSLEERVTRLETHAGEVHAAVAPVGIHLPLLGATPAADEIGASLVESQAE